MSPLNFPTTRLPKIANFHDPCAVKGKISYKFRVYETKMKIHVPICSYFRVRIAIEGHDHDIPNSPASIKMAAKTNQCKLQCIQTSKSEVQYVVVEKRENNMDSTVRNRNYRKL